LARLSDPVRGDAWSLVTSQRESERVAAGSQPLLSGAAVIGPGLINERPNVARELPHLFSRLDQQHDSRRPNVIVVGPVGSAQTYSQADLSSAVMERVQLKLAIKGSPPA
jgi:hypothetical protein